MLILTIITLLAGAPPISMNDSGIPTPLKPVPSVSATTGAKGQINTGKKSTKTCPNFLLTRECDGLPWGFPEKPVPVPIGTHTHVYGYRF